MQLTLEPGILSVMSAYPDPPFELADGSERGFDIDLMRALCGHLGLTLQRERYTSNNFDGIFDSLTRQESDAVISGTTITPDREAIVKFSDPYLEFNQGVAVNREITPKASFSGRPARAGRRHPVREHFRFCGEKVGERRRDCRDSVLSLRWDSLCVGGPGS